jgi:hypothetical protein
MEDYKKKYLKYYAKYLNLKKLQTGGMNFISISNNGGGEPGISSQCIWISIRDYLNYHKGIKNTVIVLKRSIGLGPETDHMEYNNDNALFRGALLRLCQQLNITLCFIYTSHGKIAPYCINNNNMKPFYQINIGTGNNVYIASYGAHFELIIQSPNYNLERHQNANIQGALYQPKIQIHNNFVSPSQVSPQEQQLIKASIELVEITQTIDFFREELRRVRNDIEENKEGISNIMSINLKPEETEILLDGYIKTLEASNITAQKIIRRIEDLNQEKQSYELIINEH